ncbi:hypothetical protein M8C21_024461 [Ambrosia artemisiifolia]|uniref:Uncharacterized protein n=1 Tax=Ambrosia artemisiifolia TaxID=4212 RepID=A0AAD5CPM9_AMBAR|nr:hypothetical protein M8C21_024461 [Ambrosia artemisiifolia]
MGCGKSKHAVETATTVIKSTNIDGTKQTTTATATKTIKETTTGSSLIQKETETKSLCIEDTNKKPVADSSVDKTNNAALTLAENVEKSAADVFKEDLKVKDSNATDNVAPILVENAGKAEEDVIGDEKVNGLSPVEANDVSNVVPTSSIDDVVTTEVVTEDEEKRESTPEVDNEAKIGNVVPLDEDKMKESYLLKDNISKTEFLTPTLSEDVVGPFGTVKGDEEVNDSEEETIITETSDERHVTAIDGSSNPKDDNLIVEEQMLVAQASESIKVEANKDDVAVTEVDIKAKISTATETEVPTANGANATLTQEKEP